VSELCRQIRLNALRPGETIADGRTVATTILVRLTIKGGDMRRVTRILIGGSVVILGIAGTATAASADQPPGQLGYEGQPGNQGGGGGGNPPGLLGYEGQPGNQGG
jgi:hypothetical protein